MRLWWYLLRGPLNGKKNGGLITPHHNELRDLEADLLSMVCNDVEIEPQLQDVTVSSY